MVAYCLSSGPLAQVARLRKLTELQSAQSPQETRRRCGRGSFGSDRPGERAPLQHVWHFMLSTVTLLLPLRSAGAGGLARAQPKNIPSSKGRVRSGHGQSDPKACSESCCVVFLFLMVFVWTAHTAAAAAVAFL